MQLCVTKLNLLINGIVGEIRLMRWVAAFAFRIDICISFLPPVSRIEQF